MRRDLFIPAAAITATFATGLALVVLGPGGALYLAGSLIEVALRILVYLACLLAVLIAAGAVAAQVQIGRRRVRSWR